MAGEGGERVLRRRAIAVGAVGWLVAVAAPVALVHALDGSRGGELWLGVLAAAIVVAATLLAGVVAGISAAVLTALLTWGELEGDLTSAGGAAVAVGVGGVSLALAIAAVLELRHRERLRARWLERLGRLGEALSDMGAADDPVPLIEAAAAEASAVPPPPLSLTAEHAAFLRAVADQSAAALERAALLRAEQQTRDDLELLARASSALSASLDLELVAKTIHGLLVPYLADECDLTVIAGEPRSRPRSSADPDPQVSTIPLRDRGAVIGELQLRRHGRPLSTAEESAALLVAEPASRALAHALAFSEQVQTSSTLEHSLLPAAILPIDNLQIATRYLPAAEGHAAGGDFYDVLRAPAGGAVLVVGDVQGKGVEAATLTSTARHTLRAAALAGAGPADMLDQLNRALLYGQAERLEAVGEPTVRFVTASVVWLAPTERGFRAAVASGGHPPPLLIRPGGGVEQLVVDGPLLGVFEDLSYEQREFDLGLSDVLIMYTDGVTEQREQPDLFDEAQLGRLVRNMLTSRHADAVAQQILDTVVVLSPREVRDDIALLVARVTGPR